jgi:ribonucleoside-diphosphate reductase alpha chain
MPQTRLVPARRRTGKTYDFDLGGLPVLLRVNELPDGRPVEVLIEAAKMGSTLSGLCEALAAMITLALCRAPVSEVVDLLGNVRYEPWGLTGDPEIPLAHSLTDYVAQRLAMDYLNVTNPGHG